MIFARSHRAGPRVHPTPGALGVCPICEADCIAKCGSVNAWHWAHKSREDCDSWSEGETPWHLWWKSRAQDDEVEVTMGPHRADIRNRRGLVVELQHSSISSEEIAERERFYGDMVWLFDGEPFRERFLLRPKGTYYTFRWIQPRRTLFSANKRILIDFDPHVFEVKKLYAETPCGGWGLLHTKQSVLNRLGLHPLDVEECDEIALVEIRLQANFGIIDKRFKKIEEAQTWLAKASNGGASWRTRMFRADGSELDKEDMEEAWEQAYRD